MKKITVITSTRAEFGLLMPALKALRNYENKNLKIELVVTGTHLGNEFGHTIDEIINFSKENNRPAGELNFKVAANCEVSSSPLIFKVITKILLSILIAIDEEKMLNDSLMENFFMDEILNEVTKFQLVQREKIGEMIKE